MTTNLTLQQAFGPNAFQDANVLIISKSDLPGLTPTTNNRPSQLLAALILFVHQQFAGNLIDASSTALTDETGKNIIYDHAHLYEKLVVSRWQRQYIGIGFIQDTFVIDIWIKPTEAGTTLIADNLNY